MTPVRTQNTKSLLKLYVRTGEHVHLLNALAVCSVHYTAMPAHVNKKQCDNNSTKYDHSRENGYYLLNHHKNRINSCISRFVISSYCTNICILSFFMFSRRMRYPILKPNNSTDLELQGAICNLSKFKTGKFG